MKLPRVIKRPLITEKATQELEKARYIFRVSKLASKQEIKRAVESFFKVKVNSVKTLTVKGKPKRIAFRKKIRTGDWKKAVVQLAEGDKIDILGAPEESKPRRRRGEVGKK